MIAGELESELLIDDSIIINIISRVDGRLNFTLDGWNIVSRADDRCNSILYDRKHNFQG